MQSGRLEAFSDGVLAVIITIMVLELHPPEQPTMHALVSDTGRGLLTYILSFVYVGIYWSNHHHLFQIVDHVDGVVLWANLHLLFWLSLYPFTTDWIADSHLARTPVVIYGVNLLGAAVAYFLLILAIHRVPDGKRLTLAVGNALKERTSMTLYVIGIALAFVQPWLALIPFAVVAVVWVVPDSRVERFLTAERAADTEASQ
jgi:uncharacterized membrane protein